jgi:hypothetical protein
MRAPGWARAQLANTWRSECKVYTGGLGDPGASRRPLSAARRCCAGSGSAGPVSPRGGGGEELVGSELAQVPLDQLGQGDA